MRSSGFFPPKPTKQQRVDFPGGSSKKEGQQGNGARKQVLTTISGLGFGSDLVQSKPEIVVKVPIKGDKKGPIKQGAVSRPTQRKESTKVPLRGINKKVQWIENDTP